MHTNKLHKDMEEFLLHLKPKLDAIRSMLTEHDIATDRYLDLGCGDCSLTHYVAECVKAKQVYCVDVDYGSLRKASLLGYRTYKLDLNIDKLPFENEYFGIVTAFDIIEHLMSPDNMLSEAYRSLREGGFFLLSTPNITSWYNRVLMLLGEPPLGIDLSTKWRYVYPLGVKSVISGHVRLLT